MQTRKLSSSLHPPLKNLYPTFCRRTCLLCELLGLLLGLRAELLGLVEGGVRALLGLLCGLADLVLDGGEAVLGLGLESLLAATHAVRLLVSRRLRCLAFDKPRNSSLVYVLPVVDVAVALGRLCAEVDQVATEEEVVFGRNGHSVAHEGGAVADKGGGHGTGDAVVEVSVSLCSHCD